MHRPDALVELGQVLAVLQLLEEIAARPFLPLGQRLEQTMAIQQLRDFRKACLKA